MKLSKKMKKLLVTGVVAAAILASWATWYVFFKPHRDVASEKPAFEFASKDLTEAFKKDTASLGKYIDKAILLQGPITEIEDKHVALGNIICSMDSANALKLSSMKAGDRVQIQGRLTSYNDLMDEITLDNCVFK